MGGVIRRVAKTVTKPVQQVVKEAAKISPVAQVAEAVGIMPEKKAEPVRPKEAAPAAAAASAASSAEAPAAATVTPKAATGVGGTQTQTQAQRRRGRRGIRTGARGVMGSAPVERKSLLGG